MSWRLAIPSEEGLLASFEKIQATVGKLTRAGGWGYELVSCGAQGWPGRRVMLYTKYLNDVARIAYLKPARSSLSTWRRTQRDIGSAGYTSPSRRMLFRNLPINIFH
jgi:hypothetical protein